MKVWFKGDTLLNTTIPAVVQSFEPLDEHFVLATKNMPGLLHVSCEQSGSDYVTIKTNEGIMKRTNINKELKDDSFIIEFDELYDTGKIIKVHAHYSFKFVENPDGVTFECIISNVEAKGIMGFLYRTFGKRSIGNAMLNSYVKLFNDK